MKLGQLVKGGMDKQLFSFKKLPVKVPVNR